MAIGEFGVLLLFSELTTADRARNTLREIREYEFSQAFCEFYFVYVDELRCRGFDVHFPFYVT